MRHQGQLKEEYMKQLENLTLLEIAAEAARLRSDGKRCGTATALVLRWTVCNRVADDAAKKWFYKLYSAAWTEERKRREAGLSKRPAARPAVGGRRQRLNKGARHGFAYSC